MRRKDRDRDAPSLEPPTLLGRKRRTKAAAAAPVPPPVRNPDVEAAPTRAAPEVARHEPTAEPAAPPSVADEATTGTRSQAQTVLTEPVGAGAPPEPAATRPPREPFVSGMPAACLTGLLVGLATVALTWLGLRTCEVATGTSSCGNPGFLLLIAILVAMVLAGAALLRSFRIPDPGSTSFLAVGLLTVLVLLFLVEALFSWTMVLVIPALAVGCFALSYWVTTTFVDTED